MRDSLLQEIQRIKGKAKKMMGVERGKISWENYVDKKMRV